MYNLRYHVASLVAVFLALAVGLLLGTLVAERGMITDQSSALIAGLQERFDQISATNDELRAGLERDRRFADDAADVLIAGRLQGARIVVLTGSGRADGVGAVEKAIADAGGTAIVVEMRQPGLGLGTTEPEGLAGYLFARGIEIAKPGEALYRQVADSLVTEWTGESPRELSALLDGAGLLDMPGSLEETTPISAVVVMAPADEGADAFGLALAVAMEDAGAIGVGAESADAGTGVASACAQAGLPAVGHVTTAQGRVSLVWSLAGDARGYYGPAPGADGYYPPLTLGD